MGRRIVTRDNIKELDPQALFSAMIGCKGIQVATEILAYYFEIQEEEHKEEDLDAIFAAEGIFTRVCRPIRREMGY